MSRTGSLARAGKPNPLDYVPKQIVSDGRPKKAVNPLLDNHIYIRVGRNQVLESNPSVLHFGGYQVGEPVSLHVRVVNISQESQRVHIIDPETPFFTIQYKKKGLIAPGMAEEITVIFKPTEWKYYYDTIKIHSPGENLLIPIHGYPVMNDVIFPKRIDMGACLVGQTVSQTVQMECKVPIQFEYELTPMTEGSDFHIYPQKGIIPANGGLNVHIEYTPKRRVTSELEVKVNISQFGFTPFIARLVGSAEPIANVERQAADIQDTLALSLASPERKKLARALGETASRRHLAASFSAAAKPGRTRKKHSRKPSTPPQGNNLPRVVDGVTIPRNVFASSAVNFMLNQEEGKLGIQDIQRAVEQQRKTNAQRQKELDKGLHADDKDNLAETLGETARERTSLNKSEHPLDYSSAPDVDVAFAGDSRRMKEMIFLKQCLEYSQHEKTLEINPSKGRIGHQVMSTETRGHLEAAREAQLAAERAKQRAIERDREHDVLHSPEDNRVVYVAGQKPDGQPRWDKFSNDTWDMRKGILLKFIQSISKLVTRQRVDRRVAKVRATLAAKGHTADDIAEGGETARADPPPALCKLGADTLHPVEFPIAGGDLASQRRPVEIDEFPVIVDIPHLKLKIPKQYKLIGYTEMEVPPYPAYVPPANDRVLRTGALEELADRGPRGDIPDQAEPELQMPEYMKQKYLLNHLQILRSAPHLSAHTEIIRQSEVDPDYAFRPKHISRLPEDDFYLREQCGSESLLSLDRFPTLSQVWRPHLQPVTDYEFEEASFNNVPSLLTSLPADDILEDDDEDEYEAGLEYKPLKPTVALALNLFDDDVSAGLKAADAQGEEEAPEKEEPKKKGKGKSRPQSRADKKREEAPAGEGGVGAGNKNGVREAHEDLSRVDGLRTVEATARAQNAVSAWGLANRVAEISNITHTHNLLIHPTLGSLSDFTDARPAWEWPQKTPEHAHDQEEEEGGEGAPQAG